MIPIFSCESQRKETVLSQRSYLACCSPPAGRLSGIWLHQHFDKLRLNCNTLLRGIVSQSYVTYLIYHHVEVVYMYVSCLFMVVTKCLSYQFIWKKEKSMRANYISPMYEVIMTLHSFNWWWKNKVAATWMFNHRNPWCCECCNNLCRILQWTITWLDGMLKKRWKPEGADVWRFHRRFHGLKPWRCRHVWSPLTHNQEVDSDSYLP